MAMPPAPITISGAITDLKKQIVEIKKKNNVLIGYYVEPKPVPSELKAHEPRLAILNTRLETLGRLSFSTNVSTGKLDYILDEPSATAAEYLNEIIDQLLNAIHGFQEIFEQRYDLQLKVRKPFDTIYKTIEYRESQLKNVIFEDRRPLPGTYEPRRPEDMTPSDPIFFCRGAVQLINGREKGRVSTVQQHELLKENRNVLSKYGGAFLWWQCPSCDFRARFHIAGSLSSTIHNTDEIREHPNCDVEYRSIFLAKSHLYSDPGATDEQAMQVITRRPRGRSSVGNVRINHRDSPKYGCIFCFAEERELDWDEDNIFRSGQDLAEHISERHRKGKRIPPAMMLRKFCVAIDGRLGDGAGRWELNLKN